MTESDNEAVAKLVRDNLKAAVHIYEECGYKEIE